LKGSDVGGMFAGDAIENLEDGATFATVKLMRFTKPQLPQLPTLSRGEIIRYAGLVLAGLVLGGAIAWHLYSLRPRIMPEITEVANFPLYYPQKLPSNYSLNNDSFKYNSKEGTLIFEGVDKADDHLVFTEQKRPAKFNFENFYSQQMTDAKQLNGVPYPSRYGKTSDKKTTLLSVVADDTWIIMSTTSDVSSQDLLRIAQGITKY
jgi:hypothetical protein